MLTLVICQGSTEAGIEGHVFLIRIEKIVINSSK